MIKEERLRQVVFALQGIKGEPELLQLEGAKEMLVSLRQAGIQAVWQSRPVPFASDVPAVPDILAVPASADIGSSSCLLITDDIEAGKKAAAAGVVCIAWQPAKAARQPDQAAMQTDRTADGTMAAGKGPFLDLNWAELVLEGFDEADHFLLEQTWCHGRGVPCRVAEGERIYLRELVPEDAASLYRIYHQPEVRRFVQVMNGTLQEEKEKLAAYQRYLYRFYGYGLWGICRKTDGSLLGCCGLEQKDSLPEPGLELEYVLDTACRGQGYCTEAAILALNFGVRLGYETVYARITPENRRSRMVAERIGMKKTGCLQEAGRWYDLYVWQADRPV